MDGWDSFPESARRNEGRTGERRGLTVWKDHGVPGRLGLALPPPPSLSFPPGQSPPPRFAPHSIPQSVRFHILWLPLPPNTTTNLSPVSVSLHYYQPDLKYTRAYHKRYTLISFSVHRIKNTIPITIRTNPKLEKNLKNHHQYVFPNRYRCFSIPRCHHGRSNDGTSDLCPSLLSFSLSSCLFESSFSFLPFLSVVCFPPFIFLFPLSFFLFVFLFFFASLTSLPSPSPTFITVTFTYKFIHPVTRSLISSLRSSSSLWPYHFPSSIPDSPFPLFLSAVSFFLLAFLVF